MGRAEARLVITAQLQALQIPYVGTVYPARPGIMAERAYTQRMNGEAIQNQSDGFGCVLVVNILTDHRGRIAFTGLTGTTDDMWKHRFALELWFVCVTGQAIEAQQTYDGIVDALTIAVRNNPTPGAPIWMAGGEVGTGVDHLQQQPYTDEDSPRVIYINGSLRYQVWENPFGQDV